MKNGFIKIATISPKIKVADVDFNTNECIRLATEATEKGAKLVLFPELTLTGATCGDLFFNRQLIYSSLEGLKKFVYSSVMSDTVYVIGVPLLCSNKLYSCAVAIQGGQILGIVPKSHPTCEQRRWFSPCPDLNYSYAFEDNAIMFGSKQIFTCRNMPSFKFGIEFYDDSKTPLSPSTELSIAGANLIMCMGSSNETDTSSDIANMLILAQSQRLLCGYAFVQSNMNESTTDYVYGGYSAIFENGELIVSKDAFGNEILMSEIDADKLASEKCKMHRKEENLSGEYCEIEFDTTIEETKLTRKISSNPFIPDNTEDAKKKYEKILSIQANGLSKRIVSAYAKKVVIGISGGLDSTLALLVMVRAMKILGRPVSDVVAVTMPCFGTSERTKDNATTICAELGVDFRCVNISNSVKSHFEDIGHDINNHNVVFENAQARERTQVIMDISNEVGGFVVGTGDMSELALGWATYNGDHMSNYSVNGSIPKTLVRELVRYCASIENNKTLSDALYDIADTPVSPELLPTDNDGEIAQKTEDLVGPYEIHDFYLYYMLKYGFSPAKLFRLAKYSLGNKYSDDTLKKWLKVFIRKFFTQQFKRSCLPDGPSTWDISFSPRGGWCMPSDAVANIWLDDIELI